MDNFTSYDGISYAIIKIKNGCAIIDIDDYEKHDSIYRSTVFSGTYAECTAEKEAMIKESILVF